MGLNIQMPAAFKALQKNCPGDATDNSFDSKPQGVAHTEPTQGDLSESSSYESPINTVVEDSQSDTGNSDVKDTKIRDSAGLVSSKWASTQNQGILSRGASLNTVPTVKSKAAPSAKVSAEPQINIAQLRFATSSPNLISDLGTPSEVDNADLIIPTSQPKLKSLTSTVSFQSGVDRYGFKKPLNHFSETEFDDWSREYSEYMDLRERKWKDFLKSSGLPTVGENGGAPVRFPAESQKLRRYVRKGIPPKWRGNAWFWFSRGHEKLNSHPGLYDELVESSSQLKNSDTEHIERDLNRTFPDNIYFHNDPITNEESAHLKSLRRVLRAFSVYQPKIGYCQSLNFIAANLLLMMTEDKAFWMLVIITQNYLAGLHEINLEQVNISQGILMISVRDRLPKVWSALNLEQAFEDNFISNLPPISLCTAPWFMSLMVNVLPTETMMRVWDCFFLEGPKTLFRISLTVFKLMEPELQKATDELEVFQVIQSAPRKLHDPEVLMKACFRLSNGFGHISNDDIKLLRSFVQNRRKAALEGINLGSTDRNAYAKLHRGRRVRAKLIYH